MRGLYIEKHKVLKRNLLVSITKARYRIYKNEADTDPTLKELTLVRGEKERERLPYCGKTELFMKC